MKMFSLSNIITLCFMSSNSWLFGLNGMGGGDDEASVPAAPSPYETSRQSTQAQIDSLPDILGAQEEYGPQFTQAQLDLQKQYGPQFAAEQVALEKQFGPELAAAVRASQGVLAPERIAASNLLEQEFNRPVGELLTPEEAQAFQADSRAATSVRGLGESGFGALEEVRGLTNLRNQIKMQRLNLALTSAGQLPSTATLGMGGTQVGSNQLVQNVNPSQIFGLTASNYASQLAMAGQAQAAKSDLMGGLFSGVGSIAAPLIGKLGNVGNSGNSGSTTSWLSNVGGSGSSNSGGAMYGGQSYSLGSIFN